MQVAPLHKKLLSAGVIGLLLASGFLVTRQVFARFTTAPLPQASQLHPTFALLDQEGKNVLESSQPVSTMQTCGQCHDAEFIASHSFHADLGASAMSPAGSSVSGRPWDTSNGLYGKWNPLFYRYLSPSGDANQDLDGAAWVKFFANRISGGGPAAVYGVEVNCFLCHLTQPNNAARIEAIQSDQADWSSTATLLGAGIVERVGSDYRWNPAAFSANGELAQPYVTLQDPSNSNCGQCHGLVQTDLEQVLVLTGCSVDNWQTATTGQVISGQRISLSGMNLADKASLARSWDIHAERGLECSNCHYSLNNPAYYQTSAQDRPGHLQYDPRRLEIGEYLQKPDHNLARGQSAQSTVAPEIKGTMRRCESCHDAIPTHKDWLPYTERHMQELACETCHIPQVYAPAIQMVDWTVIQPGGQPLSECRGVEGNTGTLNDLVTGFQPVLLQRSNIDGGQMLAPYNLITAWYWVYDSPDGPRPVSQEKLASAWLRGDQYAPEIIQQFDANLDGQLSAREVRLDTPEKQALIADRLKTVGLNNPRIQGEIQPYSLNHTVTNNEYVTRDCQACHADNSRLVATLKLSDYLPGGVMPQFVPDSNARASSGLAAQDGALYYSPLIADHDLYVFGHNRVSWIDWFGAALFVGVLFGVAGHGGLRFYNTLRQPPHQPRLKRVYMYAVYERFWHWLQTFTIVLLLFTGLIIHRPDMFGWLSFRYMVTVHNILAAILVINAGLSLFYHLASGEIQQFIPRPYGFFDQAIVQAKFYLQGIFKGNAHPFEKTPLKKLNPLQQATYFGILNILLPLQIITGGLMWGVQRWPQVANLFGGLPVLAPFHSLVAWTFAAFIVGHVYLTTTGHEPLSGIKAMMLGWEDVEAHGAEAEEPVLVPEIEMPATEEPATRQLVAHEPEPVVVTIEADQAEDAAPVGEPDAGEKPTIPAAE